MKAGLVVPIFDHGETIGSVVDSFSDLGLPCLIVDDGSGPEAREAIECLTSAYSWVSCVRHPRNLGRGAALRTAYRAADARGWTHVVQLDADGQHDASDIPCFLAAAQGSPDALVLGTPVFDDSVPWHRLHGRKLSQVIVWLETLSTRVADPLCGFRCVPIAPAVRVLDGARTGNRMDFDPEFVIRMVRDGVPIVNIPTSVHYPKSGISHFRMREDNLLIAWAYMRLAAEPLYQGVRAVFVGESRS